MKPWELYNHICTAQYKKSGFDLDWKVEVDNEEKKIRLMFQPTSSHKDWIINIAGFIPIFKFPVFYCWGWKTVYDNCKYLILEEITRDMNIYSDYTLEICGHSYGGAMSIIAAIDIENVTGIKSEVVTFGSPRPLFLCYSKFVGSWIIKNIKQYAHWNDCVTYCPPLIGYHNIKVIRLGKFNFKELFNPYVYHTIYGDESLYREE